MKLISMVDFVISQWDKDITREEFAQSMIIYATFLNQPLTLGMFVPCDEDGNVLEYPKEKDYFDEGFNLEFNQKHFKEVILKEYQQAKSKVLFDGFELLHEIYRFQKEKVYKLVLDGETIIHIVEKNTIEDLSFSNIYRLTPNAIKQLGL